MAIERANCSDHANYYKYVRDGGALSFGIYQEAQEISESPESRVLNPHSEYQATRMLGSEPDPSLLAVYDLVSTRSVSSDPLLCQTPNPTIREAAIHRGCDQKVLDYAQSLVQHFEDNTYKLDY